MTSGEQILLVGEPDVFADRVKGLLADQARRRAIGHCARDLVLTILCRKVASGLMRLLNRCREQDGVAGGSGFGQLTVYHVSNCRNLLSRRSALH